MKYAKWILSIAGAIAIAPAVVGIAWITLFGQTSPCDAVRVQIEETMKDDKANVRKAALEASKEWPDHVCMGIAFRLRMGDRTAIFIVK